MASSNGRPSGKLGAAYSRKAGVATTNGESSANCRASMISGSGSSRNAASACSQGGDGLEAVNGRASSTRTPVATVTSNSW